MKCPRCQTVIPDTDIRREANRIAGRGRSEAKAASSRANGRKGGRPKRVTPGAGPGTPGESAGA